MKNPYPLKRQRVVLDIIYTEHPGVTPPASWDWNSIIDINNEHERTQVVTWTEVLDGKATLTAPKFPQKDAPLLLGTLGSLQRFPAGEENENDYVLHGDSAWVRIGRCPEAVVYIVNRDDGVLVEVHENGNELAPPLGMIIIDRNDIPKPKEE